MIITRTPFRVSFFGGGSDLPAFSRRAMGAVLSTSIDKYMYLSVHPSFDGKTTVKYARTEVADRVADVKHPLVRRVLERLGIPGGVEIASTADVPAGTGLGSSSAFTVGLLNLMYAHLGQHASPSRLAREAAHLEMHDLGAPIGPQDQYASAFGGLNFIRFFPDDSVDVAPVVTSAQSRAALQASMLLFYTGEQRSASAVLSAQNTALQSEDAKFNAMKRMVELAHEAKTLLEAGQIADFGGLLDEAWRLKRSMTSSISNSGIDAMYTGAREAGAWGGKLLGAGGGGFLLVLADPAKHAALRQALAPAQELSVKMERGGSKIVYISDDA